MRGFCEAFESLPNNRIQSVREKLMDRLNYDEIRWLLGRLYPSPQEDYFIFQINHIKIIAVSILDTGTGIA